MPSIDACMLIFILFCNSILCKYSISSSFSHVKLVIISTVFTSFNVNEPKYSKHFAL